MALTAGTRFDHFDVTALLGEGGMEQVYSQAAGTLRAALHPEARECVSPEFREPPESVAFQEQFCSSKLEPGDR